MDKVGFETVSRIDFEVITLNLLSNLFSAWTACRIQCTYKSWPDPHMPQEGLAQLVLSDYNPAKAQGLPGSRQIWYGAS